MQRNKILEGVTKAFAAGAITLASISPALAVVAGPTTGQQGPTPNVQATLAAQRQQYRSQICTSTQATINARIQVREQTMNTFTLRYNNFSSKLDNLITAISAKYPEIDLSKLEQDRTQMQTMYTAAVQASTEAFNAYGSINFANCLNGTGEFKTQLNQAKTQAQVALQAHQGYWYFIENTVKADLEAIKAQIQALQIEE